MRELIGFCVQIAALSLLTAVFEQLVPDGALKRCASVGIGLVFAAAVSTEIVGIFAGKGV